MAEPKISKLDISAEPQNLKKKYFKSLKLTRKIIRLHG